MSRHETLPEQDEQFIQRQLESGRYNDRNDVIHAGLEMLQEFEAELEEWLSKEIPNRYADLKNDPSKAVSFDAARARFEKKHKTEMAKAR
ncbi:type II toxin-antitoxin system ParD family antitoxin [Rhizobium terrae]|uniref:type II toxin-antitoxin system ParD family antitoxin n=1 Tax=Rhizobium terrae TaxID=2171756 RepID=UPI000E3D1639|nr:type II toxin-antitoxin system ParD family antitoxin [Rhizobium terrae]